MLQRVGQEQGSDKAFDTMMNSRAEETICAFLNPCRRGWNAAWLEEVVIKEKERDGKVGDRSRDGERGEGEEERVE